MNLEDWYVTELKPRLAGKQMLDSVQSFDEVCKGHAEKGPFAEDFQLRFQEDRQALEHRLIARMRTHSLKGTELQEITERPFQKQKVIHGGYSGKDVPIRESIACASVQAEVGAKDRAVDNYPQIEHSTQKVNFLHDQ